MPLQSIRWPAVVALTVPSTVAAHVAGGEEAALDPSSQVVLVLLLLALHLHARGQIALRRLSSRGRPGHTRRSICFVTGSVVMAACLLPPLDTWSAELFSVHMLQHELLMLVAAPLLVLSRPLPVFLWGLPPRARQQMARWTRGQAFLSTWRLVTHPAVGWAGHAIALWVWHVPVLFRAALQSQPLHDLQHLTFVATALMFWSGLFLASSMRHLGTAVLYLFTTTLHTGVLGALITLSTQPWYAPDIRAAALPDALLDQQLGGLIMWVPGSMVYVGAGLVLFLQWIRFADASGSQAAKAEVSAAGQRFGDAGLH
jgi:putative membrane protein